MDPQKPPHHLTLLTLNVWALPYISSYRTPRIHAIAQSLLTLCPQPDIVCLQELFTHSDFTTIHSLTSSLLPHAKFYHSGSFGSGLAILSRFSFESASLSPYPLNGRPTAFWRGDWYVGKAIAHARLLLPSSSSSSSSCGTTTIDVFNTHTHPAYSGDSYTCHRLAQAWHMRKLLAQASESSSSNLIIAMGDFNMLPLSLPHRIITSTPVHDLWRVLHPDSSLGPANYPAEAARGHPIPSADYNLRENGATSNNVYNTWRWNMHKIRPGHSSVTPDTPDPLGQRIDYIFVSSGQDSRWSIKDASVSMTAQHPDLQVSLSDHFAVQATLSNGIPSSYPSISDLGVNSHNHKTSTDGDILPSSVYDEILAVIFAYTSREHAERYWRALHFFISLAVWIGCLIAVWFSPSKAISFILVIASSLGLATGVVNGLLALLFFSSEIRALKEFEWDIRNAKASAIRMGHL